MSSLLNWLVDNEPSFSKTRLFSLYSDLAVQKSTNPEGYSANVPTWQAALTRAALKGKLGSENRLILNTSNELLSELADARYGRPTGLGVVIDDCIRAGKMMEWKDFMSSDKSIYSRSWIPDPWSVLRWGLRQAGIVGTYSYDLSGNLRKGTLVLVPALEQVSKELLANQAKQGQTLTDRIMSREAFADEVAKLDSGKLSDQDMEAFLRYLARDKQLISYDSKVVKFKSQSANSPEPITSEDTTIASLKSLISGLSSQVSALETRINTLQSTAQSSVKSGNKTSALSALRSKKLAERTLQQRSDTLNQLEEVYTKIEQAVDQVEIISAMEASAGVLKSLNKKVGSVERVEDVVENLREQMGKVDEVGQVLNEPLDGKTVLDEAEVDDEFEELERQEAAKKQELESQETRRRLQQLERLEKAKGDADVDQSIKQLQRMSIEEGTLENQQHEKPEVKVAQQAS